MMLITDSGAMLPEIWAYSLKSAVQRRQRASVLTVGFSGASGMGSISAKRLGVSIVTFSIRPRARPSTMTRTVLEPGCLSSWRTRQTVPIL